MIVFYVMILSLPFMSHPLFGRTIGPLTVEKYLGALCLLYAAFHIAARRRIPRLFSTPQARAFLLFFALATASWLALGRSPSATTMLGVYGSDLLFLVTTVSLVDSLPRLRGTLLAAVAAMGFVSLYVLRDWQVSRAIYGPQYRPGYVAGDANFFTASVLLCLPIALVVLWKDRRWPVKLFCLGCLVVTLAAITLAASRGGFLGLLVMMAWLLWHSRHRTRNLLVVGLCMSLFLAVSPLSPVERFLHPDNGDSQSVQIHLELWHAGLQIVKDHPLAGIGVGQFKAAVGNYSRVKDLSLLAHNTYLEIAAEMGIPGLLLFLLTFGFSFRSLARIRRAADRDRAALLPAVATGIQAGLVGFAVASFFVSAEFLRMFWFMLFLSICLTSLSGELTAESRELAKAAKAANAPHSGLASDWAPDIEAGFHG